MYFFHEFQVNVNVIFIFMAIFSSFFLHYLFSFPRFPAKLHGKHRVGMASFRFPDSVEARIFYPIEKHNTQNVSSLPYMRKEAAYGMAKFVNLPWFIFFHLTKKSNRFPTNARILSPSPGAYNWPLVIFSHGLGGHSGKHIALIKKFLICSSICKINVFCRSIHSNRGRYRK
jgi:hypothetical protein